MDRNLVYLKIRCIHAIIVCGLGLKSDGSIYKLVFFEIKWIKLNNLLWVIWSRSDDYDSLTVWLQDKSKCNKSNFVNHIPIAYKDVQNYQSKFNEIT